MSASKASPFRRYRTRHRGVSYRKRKDGSKTYYVYHDGRYHLSSGAEKDALGLQGELRAKSARGEKTVSPSKLAFSEIAEKYYESKQSRLRTSTRKEYRSTIDRILIPKFGTRKIGGLTVDDVAGLIRDLEARKLKPSTIQAYLIPMHGVMAYAVRKGFIVFNPCDQLSEDDRPHPRAAEQEPEHVWSDEEMKALVAAAEDMARQPEARYDYSPLLRTALATGLRQSELLGLQWKDIDLSEKGERVLHVRRQYTRQGEYTLPKTKAGIRRVRWQTTLSGTCASTSSAPNSRRTMIPCSARRAAGHSPIATRPDEALSPRLRRPRSRASRFTRCDTPTPLG